MGPFDPGRGNVRVPKKKFVVHIDVADCYGINPFELTREQLILLHSSIEKVKAAREIRQREARSQMSPERAGYLTYQVTGDLKAANSAKAWQKLNEMTARNPR
jgi:hypothetical protein